MTRHRGSVSLIFPGLLALVACSNAKAAKQRNRNLSFRLVNQVLEVFDRRITKATPGRFRTRVIHEGVHPSLHIEYKKCHVKQYFKENRALRTETTINDPKDFKIGKDLSNLKVLQGIPNENLIRL